MIRFFPMPWLSAKALRGFARRAVAVDEEGALALVDRLRAQAESGDPLDVARAVVEHHARRAAMRGFLTGIPPRRLFAGVTLAMADARATSALRASMACALATIADPTFFAREDWKDEVLRALSPGGPSSPVDDVERAAPELVRRSGRLLAKGALSSAVRQAVQASLAHGLGRGSAGGRWGRALPIFAAIAGAAWHYAEFRREGRELVEAYFGYWARPEPVASTPH